MEAVPRGALASLIASALVAAALWLVLLSDFGIQPSLGGYLSLFILSQCVVLPGFLLGRLGLYLAGARRIWPFAVTAAALSLYVGVGFGIPQNRPLWTVPEGQEIRHLSVEEIAALNQRRAAPGEAFAANLTPFNVIFWLIVGGGAGAIYRIIERGRPVVSRGEIAA